MQGGLVPEFAYTPYTGNFSNKCVTDLPKAPNSDVDYWINIPADAEAMKCRVAKYGPIEVLVQVIGTSLRRYKSGIFDDPEKLCNNGTDHSFVIVGYGSEINTKGEKIDYWLVQNSWGVSWVSRIFETV